MQIVLHLYLKATKIIDFKCSYHIYTQNLIILRDRNINKHGGIHIAVYVYQHAVNFNIKLIISQ